MTNDGKTRPAYSIPKQFRPTVNRIDQLTSFVHSCTDSELVHLSQTITPLLKRDFIALLPYELALQILSYLPPRDVFSCASVSRTWYARCNDPVLWRRICYENDLKPPKENNKPLNWKVLFTKHRHTECNWRLGSHWAPSVMPAHPNWVISGSDDSSIHVWDIDTGQQLTKLHGHMAGVWSMIVIAPREGGADPNSAESALNCGEDFPLLVTGSTDRTARVWRLEGAKSRYLSTLFGHESTVRCLATNPAVQRDRLSSNNTREHFQQCCLAQHSSHSSRCRGNKCNWSISPFACRVGRLIVSGSRDTNLRLWDTHTAQCLLVFRGHRGAVRCVQFNGVHVVSGSYDTSIRVWCAWTGNCLHVLSDHQNRVYTLIFDGTRIISGSLDTTIRVWSLNGNEVACDHVLCGHQSLTSEMVLSTDGQYLISSNADETIRIWDVMTGECVHILAGSSRHESAVTCVQLTAKFILSSSDDGLVKLWDRHTGRYIRDILRLDGAGSGGVIWRILASEDRLVCAAGSRNGAEETKIIVFHFDESEDGLAGHRHGVRMQSVGLSTLLNCLPPKPFDHMQSFDADDDFLSHGSVSYPASS